MGEFLLGWLFLFAEPVGWLHNIHMVVALPRDHPVYLAVPGILDRVMTIDSMVPQVDAFSGRKRKFSGMPIIHHLAGISGTVPLCSGVFVRVA